jgi:rhodanese-related sulfurtransferase
MKAKNVSAAIIVNAVLLLIIVSMPQQKAAEASTTEKHISGSTVDPSLAKSVAAAMFGHKAKKITIIDVRSATDFIKFHIPGSLNIPLHAIRTKTYLKSKSIVLVNSGYLLSPLAKTCQKLNTEGFKAAIMAGGLCAWKTAGGPLTGDHFDQREMNIISPAQFHREKAFEHQMVVHLLEGPAVKKETSRQGVHHMSLSKPDSFIARIKALVNVKNANAFSNIVITTQTGEENHRVQRLLAGIGLQYQVFMLRGGRKAYKKHVAHTALAQKPKNERTMRTGGCPSCAQE